MINFNASPALLFTPGNKPERFQKAQEVEANGIILDLEDAVAESDKEQARKSVFAYLAQKNKSKLLRIIRINHLSTSAGLADLLALASTSLYFDALIYPKTQTPDEINLISAALEKQNPKLPIIAFIETAQGFNHIDAIVRQSKNLSALTFGAADYAVDVGCAIDFEALLLARMQIVQAAAVRKLACYDSPYFDFKDDSGLTKETQQVKKFGFTGKLAIHPQQIAIIRSTFKPTEAELKEAREIIAIYETVKGAACQYQGKMIDVPVYQKAKQILETYQNLS